MPRRGTTEVLLPQPSLRFNHPSRTQFARDCQVFGARPSCRSRCPPILTRPRPQRPAAKGTFAAVQLCSCLNHRCGLRALRRGTDGGTPSEARPGNALRFDPYTQVNRMYDTYSQLPLCQLLTIQFTVQDQTHFTCSRHIPSIFRTSDTPSRTSRSPLAVCGEK